MSIHFKHSDVKSKRWRCSSIHSDTSMETNLTHSDIGKLCVLILNCLTAQAKSNCVQQNFETHLQLIMADKDKAHLGCLEEDDEFEEFPAEGKRYTTLFY